MQTEHIMGDCCLCNVYETDNGKIIAEHGNRYDVICAKNPVSQPGHILPLGFFITRTAYQNKQDSKGTSSEAKYANIGSTPTIVAAALEEYSKTEEGKKQLNAGIIDFPNLAFWAAMKNFKRVDDENVIMGGINEYKNPITFGTAKSMFPFTDDKWNEIREEGVVTNWGESFWHSADIFQQPNFFRFANDQYFENPNLKVKPRVVIFGHTHYAMWQEHIRSGAVYLNSGTWVDDAKRVSYVEVDSNQNYYFVKLYDFKNKSVQFEQIVRK